MAIKYYLDMISLLVKEGLTLGLTSLASDLL